MKEYYRNCAAKVDWKSLVWLLKFPSEGDRGVFDDRVAQLNEMRRAALLASYGASGLVAKSFPEIQYQATEGAEYVELSPLPPPQCPASIQAIDRLFGMEGLHEQFDLLAEIKPGGQRYLLNPEWVVGVRKTNKEYLFSDGLDAWLGTFNYYFKSDAERDFKIGIALGLVFFGMAGLATAGLVTAAMLSPVGLLFCSGLLLLGVLSIAGACFEKKTCKQQIEAKLSGNPSTFFGKFAVAHDQPKVSGPENADHTSCLLGR